MSGSKQSAGKLQLDLIPLDALEAAARALEYGANKYERGNFAKGVSHSLIIAAIIRHTYAYSSGEDLDKESGLSHVDHILAGASILAYLKQNKPELDDRWAKKKEAPPGELSLKYGRRYRRRDGRETGRLAPNPPLFGTKFPFHDPTAKTSYTPGGQFLEDQIAACDLVEELPD